MKNELNTDPKKPSARSIFLEGSQLSRKATRVSFMGFFKNILTLFFDKKLNRNKMGQIWTKWVQIDRDRFLSVSGPRIFKCLPNNHYKIIKIGVSLILAGFGGVTMVPETHGSPLHRPMKELRKYLYKVFEEFDKDGSGEVH